MSRPGKLERLPSTVVVRIDAADLLAKARQPATAIAIAGVALFVAHRFLRSR